MAKNKAQKPKKGGFLQTVTILAVAGISVSLMVAFVSGQMELSSKQQELNAVTVQVERQTEKNAELSHLKDSGDEDAYVERIAREKLGYVRPDERVFVDITGK